MSPMIQQLHASGGSVFLFIAELTSVMKQSFEGHKVSQDLMPLCVLAESYKCHAVVCVCNTVKTQHKLLLSRIYSQIDFVA